MRLLSRSERITLSKEEQAFFYITELVRQKKLTLVDELNTILQSTKNHQIRDSVAQILYTIKDKTSLKPFINAIKQPYTKNHRGYLVLCCEAYNCSPYLLFFIELVLTDNYYTASNSILVIKSMEGPFKKGQLEKAVNQLDHFLNNNNYNDRTEMIKDLLDNLRDKKDFLGM